MQRILAVIPARGGSKGLPGKNVRPLAGLPLIGHSLRFAAGLASVARTVVSTDDPGIAELARGLGGDVPFLRPPELARDDTPMAPVVRHALEWVERSEGQRYDAVLLLDPTSPVRDPERVGQAVHTLWERPEIDGVISVSAPTFNPLWVGVEETPDDTVRRFFPEAAGVTRRQDNPRRYLRINGNFYLWRADFVRRLSASWFDEGTFASVEIPESEAFSIDDEAEFGVLEALLRSESAASAGSGVQDLFSLDGRVAIVTGGAGPLGSVFSRALADLGASVAIVDKTQVACDAALATLPVRRGASHTAIAVDLTAGDAASVVLTEVRQRYDRLDVLVNNAAFTGASGLSGYAVPFDEQTPEAFSAAMALNLLAPFALTQQAAELLRKSGHGSVVNISSIYGLVGPNMRLYDGTTMGNPAAYGATKGGIAQLTRYLATVLAPDIRVNAIAPGGIERGQDERFLERYSRLAPLGRMATEDDMRGALAWLASDASSYVTGQVVAVDGGWTAW